MPQNSDEPLSVRNAVTTLGGEVASEQAFALQAQVISITDDYVV